MLYFIAEDEYYYTTNGSMEITEKYSVDSPILFPEMADIKQVLSSNTKTKKCFIAPYLPSAIDKKFEKSSFFEVVRLKNKHGFLTTGQKESGITEVQALEEKLGVKIHEPKNTFDDYGGANILRELLLTMEEKEKYGLDVKGFMIAGIPGTGKTFFAKCAAGETKRKLVELNLSMFMEMEDGLFALSQFFDFFITNQGRYIIWIDEIEKMFIGDRAKQMLGVLLTRINDLNAEGTESSFFFIATANNISGLAKTNPEFFRNGRFDVLAFILNPTQDNAKTIFNLYIKKFIKKFKTEILPIMFKNVNENKTPREGTKADLIFQTISKKCRHEINLFDNKEKNDFLQIINNNPTLLKVYTEILEQHQFSFDVMEFILTSIRIYGEQSVMTERYVHTPAEIEYVVQDAFSSYYFSSKKYTMYDLANKYQPLQVTMKEAIQNMLGTADKFIKI